MLTFAGLGGAYILYRGCTELGKAIKAALEEKKK